MTDNVKTCLVCKQPITGVRIVAVNGGYVHGGQCETYFREQEERLNEAEAVSVVSDTELLL